jgi:hypothetical protein
MPAKKIEPIKQEVILNKKDDSIKTPISSIPTIDHTSATKDSIGIYWNGDSDDYYVKSSLGDSGWITNKNYTYSNLTCGTSYTFQIKGRNNDGIQTDYLVVNKSTSSCNTNNSSSGGYILKINYIEKPQPLENEELLNLNRILKLKNPRIIGEDVRSLQIYLNSYNYAIPIKLITTESEAEQSNSFVTVTEYVPSVVTVIV